VTEDALRELVRACEERPEEPLLVERAVAEHRRLGVPVPGVLLERVRSPATTFESERAFTLRAVLPDGTSAWRGRTPGSVKIPEHRWWWVELDRADLAEARSELAKARGVAVHGSQPLGEHDLDALPGDIEVLHARVPASRAVFERIARLGKLASLELALPRGEVASDVLVPLGRLARLQRLKLNVTPRGGLPFVGDLPELIELSLACGAYDVGLYSFLRGASLRSLELTGIEGAGFTTRVLANVAALTQLRRLALRRCRLDPALEGLERLVNLEQLALHLEGLGTYDALRAISPLTNLRELDLTGTQVGPIDLEATRTLSRLETLWLRTSSGVTDEGLSSVPASLKRLAVRDSAGVTGRFLATMPALREVELDELRNLRGVAFRALRQRRHLASLSLQGSPVHDEDLELLRGHPALARISLRRTEITDLALEHLATLPRLRQVDADHCHGITRRAFKDFRKRFPESFGTVGPEEECPRCGPGSDARETEDGEEAAPGSAPDVPAS
jgi:hypothetical protein